MRRAALGLLWRPILICSCAAEPCLCQLAFISDGDVIRFRLGVSTGCSAAFCAGRTRSLSHPFTLTLEHTAGDSTPLAGSERPTVKRRIPPRSHPCRYRETSRTAGSCRFRTGTTPAPCGTTPSCRLPAWSFLPSSRFARPRAPPTCSSSCSTTWASAPRALSGDPSRPRPPRLSPRRASSTPVSTRRPCARRRAPPC